MSDTQPPLVKKMSTPPRNSKRYLQMQEANSPTKELVDFLASITANNHVKSVKPCRLFYDNLCANDDESITKQSTPPAVCDPYRSVHMDPEPHQTLPKTHCNNFASTNDTFEKTFTSIADGEAIGKPRVKHKLRAEAAEFIPRTSPDLVIEENAPSKGSGDSRDMPQPGQIPVPVKSRDGPYGTYVVPPQSIQGSSRIGYTISPNRDQQTPDSAAGLRRSVLAPHVPANTASGHQVPDASMTGQLERPSLGQLLPVSNRHQSVSTLGRQLPLDQGHVNAAPHVHVHPSGYALHRRLAVPFQHGNCFQPWYAATATSGTLSNHLNYHKHSTPPALGPLPNHIHPGHDHQFGHGSPQAFGGTHGSTFPVQHHPLECLGCSAVPSTPRALQVSVLTPPRSQVQAVVPHDNGGPSSRNPGEGIAPQGHDAISAHNSIQGGDPQQTGVASSHSPAQSTASQCNGEVPWHYSDSHEQTSPIMTETYYIGTKLPDKYASGMEYDSDGKVVFPPKPLPPDFVYRKRSIPRTTTKNAMIPLYGSVSGMFYDPLTELYHGDGEPRATPYRTDGTWPPTINQARDGRKPTRSRDTRKIPADMFHVQTALEVRNRMLDFGRKNGVIRWKLCRCTGAWEPEEALKDHVCKVPTIEGRVQATPVTQEKLRAAQAHKRFPSAPAGSSSSNSDEGPEAITAGEYGGVATQKGDGDQTEVQIHDFADSSIDGRRVNQFTGSRTPDFAYPRAGAKTIYW